MLTYINDERNKEINYIAVFCIFVFCILHYSRRKRQSRWWWGRWRRRERPQLQPRPVVKQGRSQFCSEWLISIFLRMVDSSSKCLRNVHRISDFLTRSLPSELVDGNLFIMFEKGSENWFSYQVPALWIDLGENLDDVCCCYPIPPGSSLSIMFEIICI